MDRGGGGFVGGFIVYCVFWEVEGGGGRCWEVLGWGFLWIDFLKGAHALPNAFSRKGSLIKNR